MKRKIFIFSLFFGFTFGLVGCNDNDKEKDEPPVGDCILNPEQEKCQPVTTYEVNDEDNIIYVEKNAEFKILQLSDLHIAGNKDAAYANGKPSETYNFVRKLVNENKPDMIVLTGDNLFDYSSTGARDIRVLMDEFELPWTFVYGNHDATSFAFKQAIAKEFLKSEYCVFQNQYDNGDRYGDHLIQLRENETKKLVYSFYLFDSGTYSYSLPTGGAGYESVNEDQLTAYKNTMNALQARYSVQKDNAFSLVPHIIFQHICIEEFKTAFDLHVKKDPLVEYLYGVRNETECHGKVNTAQFTAMKEVGAKAMFVGHDHVNTYAVIYDGILLGYGGQAGYSNTYLNNETQEKNGVLITINSERNITSKLVF